MTPPTRERLEAAYQTALSALLAERTPEGYWVGELSTSALSTAVAVAALALARKSASDPLVAGGLAWLADHQNADGGWGDTVKSFSNISTTMLCRSAFHLTGGVGRFGEVLGRSDAWLAGRYGATPEQHAEGVRARYGKDRTFSVSILMTSALAGLVSWREVPSLPFELACFPQAWFRFLRLPVVSYALPALIAIGQAVHHHRRPWDPVRRIVRRLAVGRSLKVLAKIQPPNGGFLEATPLTSFVALALAGTGRADHPVVRRCVEFIVASVRPDGSWPIDTNLATWVTTLAVNALAGGGDLAGLEGKEELTGWLMRQQYWERHPYTGAEPGAWAWTPLPGGVPDADDTPGALLGLRQLIRDEPRQLNPVETFTRRAIGQVELDSIEKYCWNVPVELPASADAVGLGVVWGLSWLLGLQNTNGGWPTFCRGWGNLPFDRSGSDLTAHALRALHAWRPSVARGWFARTFSRWFGVVVRTKAGKIAVPSVEKLDAAVKRGLAYLARSQHADGSWLPLWFGNQHAPDDVNPTYGTARVLAAYRDLDLMDSDPARKGVSWLLSAQNPDGGWGGAAGTPSSVEETALAVEVLLDAGPDAEGAVNRGLTWLVERVEAGGLYDPAPIGFYFAKLWYFEKLYPIIFAVAALGRARRRFAAPPP
jgi:squalene-hopene/tetraprenyl-beta-curcumene cyclase